VSVTQSPPFEANFYIKRTLKLLGGHFFATLRQLVSAHDGLIPHYCEGALSSLPFPAPAKQTQCAEAEWNGSGDFKI
jgi:hypothetical protein